MISTDPRIQERPFTFYHLLTLEVANIQRSRRCEHCLLLLDPPSWVTRATYDITDTEDTLITWYYCLDMEGCLLRAAFT